MKMGEALSSTWEDLVFENRNKAYGAFEIRKSYSRNILEATVASVLFAGLLLGYPKLFRAPNDRAHAPLIEIDPGITIQPPPVVKLLEKKIKPTALVKEVKPDVIPVPTPAIVPDPEFKEKPTEIQTTGTASGTEIPTGSAYTAQQGTEIATPAPALVDHAEVMPTFSGGYNAMMKFIQKNLRYPAHSRRMGTEGKVFVRFVVNYEGNVVNVEVIRGIAEDCDKEAARVIAMLPAWTPGRQNQMPVSVRMVLPINFQLEN